MEKHATVRFKQERYDYWGIRYVHKFYLPQELKSKVFLADIDGIVDCFREDEECNLREKRIPERLSDCVIHYKDLGLEKRIEGDTARRILVAYAEYKQDRRAELTSEETLAALNLNAWLVEWEKQLLTRCVQLSEDMERRVRSGDPWLSDYEMDLMVYFYVRDDDPFSEDNSPEASKDDVDQDASLLCQTSLTVSLPISAAEVAEGDYWGIGDNMDHKDVHPDTPIYQVRHCATFHELYGHMYVPMKHMGRIGYISADIIVQHQRGISVDLAGVKAIAVPNVPRIRMEMILIDEALQKSATS